MNVFLTHIPAQCESATAPGCGREVRSMWSSRDPAPLHPFSWAWLSSAACLPEREQRGWGMLQEAGGQAAVAHTGLRPTSWRPGYQKELGPVAPLLRRSLRSAVELSSEQKGNGSGQQTVLTLPQNVSEVKSSSGPIINPIWRRGELPGSHQGAWGGRFGGAHNSYCLSKGHSGSVCVILRPTHLQRIAPRLPGPSPAEVHDSLV